ncbi:hypothetical protein [Mesorhizobium shangrilense]|uniref:Uncharacterized protein n=1 Tax=Mesorhizobium shangrilense TaxID=460060 RepID=A0ABV2DKU2_9HYPH
MDDLGHVDDLAAGHLGATLEQSGKEAEKPLGKIFAKMLFDAIYSPMLSTV